MTQIDLFTFKKRLYGFSMAYKIQLGLFRILCCYNAFRGKKDKMFLGRKYEV
jgi:hypothetical protein